MFKLVLLLPPTELDIFGIILYSVLTFMAAVSMLVYIEECIYIYKKVPAKKKSIIIWVNGAAPVSPPHPPSLCPSKIWKYLMPPVPRELVKSRHVKGNH